MNVPSIGFEIPMVGLIVGLIVMVVGLFMGGLTLVAYAGLVIGGLGILGLILEAVNVPHPE